MPTDHTATLKKILSAQLGPSYPPEHFRADTELLGSIPELDSMAVVGILTAVEEELGVTIEDDEVSAELFETFGSLADFVRPRLQKA
jgi:acyl carrier protein